MTNLCAIHCKSSVLFSQACQSSNINIGYNSFGLTRMGLPSDSTCILKAEPGKLDIKRREPGILFISLNVPIISLFKLTIMT